MKIRSMVLKTMIFYRTYNFLTYLALQFSHYGSIFVKGSLPGIFDGLILGTCAAALSFPMTLKWIDKNHKNPDGLASGLIMIGVAGGIFVCTPLAFGTLYGLKSLSVEFGF